MSRIAIGTMVHDEAWNLPRLLPHLAGLAVDGHRIDPLVVVASGCTDGSVPISQEFAASDARFRVIVEPSRTGKANAINLFLDALPDEVEICVLVNGDVLPAPDAVRHLLAPFTDARVGMAGARPIPVNRPDSVADRVVRFQWEMHHQVALRRPKLGELVAFRRSGARLPPETAVDEATLEADVVRSGLDLAYAPDAIVWNRGPDNLPEYLDQRARIWAGHLWLWRRTGYRVSTFGPRDLAGPLAHHLRAHPEDLPVALLAALLEGTARCRGTVDLLVRGRNPTLWPPQPSTRRWAGQATP